MNKKNLAIIVVDMRHDFVDEGAPVKCEGAREIIPHIKRLLDFARRKGIPVIYTKCIDVMKLILE